MTCTTCNQPLETDAVFCGNCGSKQTTAAPVNYAAPQQASYAEQPTATAQPNAKVEEVKAFFKNDMGKIVKSIFAEPIKGTVEIFTNTGTNAYSHALILIGTTVVAYTLIPYLWVGSEVRQYMSGAFGMFLKFGLSVGLVLVIISALSFGIKSVSGKPDFKKELLTGAMCGIPLMMMLLAFIIFSLFSPRSFSNFNPSAIMQQGILSGVIMLYLMLMLINIVQQSFKASGTNDALSWYAAPLVVFLGFYIGVRLAIELFGGGMPGMF